MWHWRAASPRVTVTVRSRSFDPVNGQLKPDSAAFNGSAKPAKRPTKSAKGSAKAAGGKAKGALRVRMYRVGFGDFFLLTVPAKTGAQHILIDCGVHAGDIKSMDACVQDLVKETNRKLALVVATHYHADHLSGFASNFDEFAQFEVGAVWITNRLDPKNDKASKFKAQITSLANQLQLRLGARDDDAGRQAFDRARNAIGVQLGAKEGGNEKALRLLTKGFKNTPPVFYYQGGDEPELPEVLKGALTAELLGPAPLDSGGEFSGTDNKKEQYLSAAAESAAEEGLPSSDCLEPFEKHWPASAADYPAAAFREYRTREQIDNRQPGSPGSDAGSTSGARSIAALRRRNGARSLGWMSRSNRQSTVSVVFRPRP